MISQIDGGAIARSFLLRQARRKVENLVDRVGEERIQWMIANGVGFADVQTPEMLAETRREVARYAPLRRFLAGVDLSQFLPPKLLSIVTPYGPQGQKWLATQVKWLNSLIAGG